MNSEIIKFLKTYSTTESKANTLIVSSFVNYNNILVKKNKLVKGYLCVNDSKQHQKVIEFNHLLAKHKVTFDFEFLIELFEFIISPKDKIVNGAVYTPRYIRDYIVGEIVKGYKGDISDALVCDFSVGCGGFLFSMTEAIKLKTNKSYRDIFEKNIYGLDITLYSIERSKLLLSLLALSNGEDNLEFHFNLEHGDALQFAWKEAYRTIKKNNGFDIILGNPPYVCSRNINNKSFKLLSKWSVCKTGHPDLYIPFFQIGLENLSEHGVLGYITVNTFFKSINGRALRLYFNEKEPLLRIINFGGEQVFKNRNTYTCLCFLTKSTQGQIQYIAIGSHSLNSITEESYKTYSYDFFNNVDGWDLVSSKAEDDFIQHIEKTGTKLKDRYTTRNGIATLKNDVYKFTPTKENNTYYYFNKKSGKEIKIEKAICRDVINSNRIKTQLDIQKRTEKIIFPYYKENDQIKIIGLSKLKSRYPLAYKYLEENKGTLSTRDKGKGKNKYETWYAYGRRQSLNIDSYKLFFPHICERPSFVLSRDKELLFYNGIAIISDDFDDLLVLKKILESSLFYDYVRKTTKNYSSGFFSLSKNYIKNFGIYDFDEKQKRQLLGILDKNEIDDFIRQLYFKEKKALIKNTVSISPMEEVTV